MQALTRMNRADASRSLDVNNFDAIRISLASPEDIRSWSYGEVTKPETINYRTLKPEHGGLFCERIFGPTKDWECYCGKYKRIRHAGTVCDKCGVEVTRAKVRRERMGHIELAAPATHIWYVKGTPSRLGLLLDVSPRNLERVLYFASYLITEVNTQARDELVETIRLELEEELAELQGDFERQTAEISGRRDQEIAVLVSGSERVASATEKELETELAAFDAEASTVLETLGGLHEAGFGAGAEKESAGAPKKKIELRGQVLVKAGEAVNEDRLARAKETVEELRAGIVASAQRTAENAEVLSEAEADQIQQVTGDQLRRLQDEYERQQIDLRAEADDIIKQIMSLAPNQVLTETQYRELADLAPGVFKAGMGAESVYSVVEKLDLDVIAADLRTELHRSTGMRKKKAAKRLRVVEALRKSGNAPEWMIFTALPVIPPDLRPMVQLDGGRFATSDLNDLYRRVINRNNRLKRLLELGAPDIIVRNEKRMLQEAVDALIDNGRRGRVVSGSGKHKLKSLSDMLKGKQGRFRQNLLGKRVDYSGRSVIVVGPDLKLHQCGLPKRMALELFKPFVMHRLVANDHAHNIKAAKRLVERVDPVVWDVMEEVITDYVVLLNRAPTLHRLGIQAFEVKLIEGSAIQVHPLVCPAFNADFDGDQMAVHVPLSRKAQAEARARMMSTSNLLDPSDGDPVIAPTLEIVLGSYYLTTRREGEPGEGKLFANATEAVMAYQSGVVGLHAPIRVFDPKATAYRFPDVVALQAEADLVRDRLDEALQAGTELTSPILFQGHDLALAGDVLNEEQVAVAKQTVTDVLLERNAGPHARETLVDTTVGRVIFNLELPHDMPYRDELMDRGALKRLIKDLYHTYGPARTAEIADLVKKAGFHFATVGGLTIGLHDVATPPTKGDILGRAEEAVREVDRDYNRGLITTGERRQEVISIWTAAREELQKAVEQNLTQDNALYMMSFSGAKGNMNQISQMAGMRGLMMDPRGNIMDFPIRSNFREGLSVFEYFISTHGARKGLADTALRTAESGYLTRRLVDVAQDVIINEDDCGVVSGMVVSRGEGQIPDTIFRDRVLGRMAAATIVTRDGEILRDRNEEIDEDVVEAVIEHDVPSISIRTVMNCQSEHGVCAMCYGRNLATGKLVENGEAVGIIAAQSIGEPGTQLTMRTFHTGGVSHADDITTGLPRVQELFEAREPKGKALLSEIEGVVTVVTEDEQKKVIISHHDPVTVSFSIPAAYRVVVREGANVRRGDELAVDETGVNPPVVATVDGEVVLDEGMLRLLSESSELKEYTVAHTAHLRVDDGDRVQPGTQLTDGALDPQEVLSTLGSDHVQRLIVDDVQNMYRSQGVVTNDKHIEIIVRQMLRKVSIDDPGDTDLLPGELVDRYTFNRINEEMIAQGGDPSTAVEVILGITKASLETESFLSAASFQETTRVLTQAAIEGKVDFLRGLKENVIIGKLIPAGSGFDEEELAELEAGSVFEIDELAEVLALQELEPRTIEQVEELMSAPPVEVDDQDEASEDDEELDAEVEEDVLAALPGDQADD